MRARRERFETIYRQQVRSILAYALRRIDQADDAADVVAETMLVAWRRLDDVPPGDEARLWLFGVARRVLANHRRGTLRRDRLGERLRRDLSSELSAVDLATGVETSLVVRAALDRLSDDDREILRLTVWEGLDPAAIAVVLAVPPATARSRLHRARARLRQQLDELEWAGERCSPSGHVHHDERVLVRDAEEEP